MARLDEALKAFDQGYIDDKELAKISLEEGAINEDEYKAKFDVPPIQEPKVEASPFGASRGITAAPKFDPEKETENAFGSFFRKTFDETTRKAKAVGAGVASTVKTGASGLKMASKLEEMTPGHQTSMLSVLKSVGLDTLGEAVRKKAGEVEKSLTPKDPTFADQIAMAGGSTLPGLIPGIGVFRGAQALGGVAQRMAPWFGATASAMAEALSNAGQAYERGIEKGMKPEEAATKGSMVFWGNLPVNAFFDRYGLMSKTGKPIAKALASAVNEGLQEPSQYILGNLIVNDPVLLEEVVRSGLLGAATGGVLGGAVGTYEFMNPIDIAEKNGLSKDVVLEQERQKFSQIINDIENRPVDGSDIVELDNRLKAEAPDLTVVRPETGQEIKAPVGTEIPSNAKSVPLSETKAIDSSGNPILVHHVTTADFDIKDLKRSQDSIFTYGEAKDSGGLFFDSNPENLDYYIAGSRGGVSKGARTISGYLDIKNPIKLTSEEMGNTLAERAQVLHAAEANGYDGAIIDGHEYVIFKPEQFVSKFSDKTIQEGTKVPEVTQAQSPTLPPTTPTETATGPEGEPDLTSNKNAAVDTERIERGLKEMPAPETLTNKVSWEEAKTEIEKDPYASDNLILELKEKPRSVSPKENALLLHKRVQLKNEYAGARDRWKQAFESGDLALAEEESKRKLRYANELSDLDEVTKTAGTEAGRALQSRIMGSDEDFELVSMELDSMEAKGAELTPKEQEEVEKTHSKIQDLEKKLEIAKKRMTKRIADYEERIKRGEYVKEKKPPLELDEEGKKIKAELELVKKKFKEGLDKYRWAKLSVFSKTKKTGVALYDAARVFMTTGEFSFVLRQGLPKVLGHPIIGAKSLKESFKAFFSSDINYRALENEIFDDPEFGQALAAKLPLSRLESPLSKQEEAFLGQFTDKIPLIRRFNRAGIVFLNKLRFGVWKVMRKSMSRTGIPTLEEDRQIAKDVGIATGRGDLGPLEPSAVFLSRLMFSPRYIASRFQYLMGTSMWGGTARTRKVIAQEYARTLIGYALYSSLVWLYFNRDKKTKGESDPRSTDFGKIIIDKTRLDLMAGLGPVTTYLARTATGEKKTQKGKVVPIRGKKVPYGQDRWEDVSLKFAKSKAHPVPAAIVSLFNGTDFMGEEATLEKEAGKMIRPITYIDIYEALKENNLPDGVALSILAFFGAGLQVHDKK